MPITLFSASVCWWRAWRLRRRSAIHLTRRSYCRSPANWVAEPWEKFGGDIGFRYYVGHEPRHWLCGSLERRCHKPCWLHGRLSDPQERLSHLLCQKAYELLYKKSPKRLERESYSETWERVLLETLGLMEPEERSCSNFSWSNSTTSDSTVDPRSLRSAYATAFSLIKKTFLSGVVIFCLIEKVGRCKVSLSGWKVTMERFRIQKRGEELVLPFV